MAIAGLSKTAKASKLVHSGNGTETNRLFFESLCNVDGLYGDNYRHKRQVAGMRRNNN